MFVLEIGQNPHKTSSRVVQIPWLPDFHHIRTLLCMHQVKWTFSCSGCRKTCNKWRKFWYRWQGCNDILCIIGFFPPNSLSHHKPSSCTHNLLCSSLICQNSCMLSPCVYCWIMQLLSIKLRFELLVWEYTEQSLGYGSPPTHHTQRPTAGAQVHSHFDSKWVCFPLCRVPHCC